MFKGGIIVIHNASYLIIVALSNYWNTLLKSYIYEKYFSVIKWLNKTDLKIDVTWYDFRLWSYFFWKHKFNKFHKVALINEKN